MRASNGLTCVVLTLLLGAGVAYGAPGDGNQPRPGGGGPGGGEYAGLPQGQHPALPDSSGIEKMVDEMSAALSLTGEQEEQIRVLHFAHFAEVKDRVADGRPDRRAMEALREKFESDVKSELRDDQTAAYEKYVANHRPRAARSGRRR
ncbi:MAG: hypothetical protein GY838_16840 [bacterium]|nr:hypothetical protein [bacterium]